MVAAPPKLEVRAVGAESFDDIAPLFDLFENRKMSREDWRAMLFTYPWWDGAERGHALYADGVAVGFMGTIFSRRTIRGRDETFCNASCWIVREAYRSASILLLRPLLAMRDCTIVNWTPTARSYEIFKKLGFKALESQSLLLPAIAPPWSFVGTSTDDPRAIACSLDGVELEIYRNLASRPNVRHTILRHGDRRCYVVATHRLVRSVPIADVHYVGDREFFWTHRGLAHVAFFRAFGALGMAIDARFSAGRTLRIAFRRQTMRLYRPAHDDTAPDEIDGLFTEMMTLRL